MTHEERVQEESKRRRGGERKSISASKSWLCFLTVSVATWRRRGPNELPPPSFLGTVFGLRSIRVIFSINGRWVVIHVELFHPEPWPTYAYRDNRLMAHLLDDRSMSEGSIEPASRATSNPLSYICDTLCEPLLLSSL